ncbi:hypothetical protein DFJ77DRAFT_464417 [Powellomyces hirtus]|nr:hypothetical protein DFJ77DRAFT_464417 [Powellomyces hirtus]
MLCVRIIQGQQQPSQAQPQQQQVKTDKPASAVPNLITPIEPIVEVAPNRPSSATPSGGPPPPSAARPPQAFGMPPVGAAAPKAYGGARLARHHHHHHHSQDQVQQSQHQQEHQQPMMQMQTEHAAHLGTPTDESGFQDVVCVAAAAADKNRGSNTSSTMGGALSSPSGGLAKGFSIPTAGFDDDFVDDYEGAISNLGHEDTFLNGSPGSSSIMLASPPATVENAFLPVASASPTEHHQQQNQNGFYTSQQSSSYATADWNNASTTPTSAPLPPTTGSPALASVPLTAWQPPPALDYVSPYSYSEPDPPAPTFSAAATSAATPDTRPPSSSGGGGGGGWMGWMGKMIETIAPPIPTTSQQQQSHHHHEYQQQEQHQQQETQHQSAAEEIPFTSFDNSTYGGAFDAFANTTTTAGGDQYQHNHHHPLHEEHYTGFDEMFRGGQQSGYEGDAFASDMFVAAEGDGVDFSPQEQHQPQQQQEQYPQQEQHTEQQHYDFGALQGQHEQQSASVFDQFPGAQDGSVQNQQHEMDAKLAEGNADREALRAHIAHLENEVRDAQHQREQLLKESEDEREALGAQVAHLEQEARNSQQNWEAVLEEANKDRERLREQVQQLQQQQEQCYSNAVDNNRDNERAVAELRSQLADVTAERDQLRHELQQQQQHSNHHNNDKDKDTSSAAEQIAGLHTQLAQATSERDQLRAQLVHTQQNQHHNSLYSHRPRSTSPPTFITEQGLHAASDLHSQLFAQSYPHHHHAHSSPPRIITPPPLPVSASTADPAALLAAIRTLTENQRIMATRLEEVNQRQQLSSYAPSIAASRASRRQSLYSLHKSATTAGGGGGVSDLGDPDLAAAAQKAAQARTAAVRQKLRALKQGN